MVEEDKKEIRDQKIEQDSDDDEEINIDFSKITNFFKKKRTDKVENLKEETKELKEEIKEKVEDLEEKQEVVENISKDLKEDKQKAKEADELDEDIKEKEEKIERIKKEIPIEEDKDEEINIDFSKIKNIFKKKEKTEKVKTKEDDEINIDLKQSINSTLTFLKKHQVVLLLLIPIFLSIFFRAYPIYLPITDEWAEDSVHNNIKANIESQINQQYPNLPDTNKQLLVDSQFEKVLIEQKTEIESQIVGTSNYFKSKMRDESDQTYLLAIDPYLWYGEIKASLDSGFFGDYIDENGKKMYSLRNGRLGKSAEEVYVVNLYAGKYLYKFMHFFNKNVTLMGAFFLVPMLVITLSLIPAFFIGKKISGNIGGLFASTIIAINAALLGRTPAGFSDTDAYNIFFPLFISWMFIEALESKSIKKRITFSAIAGVLIGIYSRAWSGWWYPMLFVLASLGLILFYYAIRHFKEYKLNIIKYFKEKNIKNLLIILSVFLGISIICVSATMMMIGRPDKIALGFLGGPTQVKRIKEVGVITLWPNVLTTVAEFNVVPLSNIINQMGGPLLFWISLIGISLLMFNWKRPNSKNILFLISSSVYYLFMILLREQLTNPFQFIILLSIPIILGVIKIFMLNEEEETDIKFSIFLMLWFIGTIYGFTKGTRFAILMVPAFGIAFGIAINAIYEKLSSWLSDAISINKIISRSIVLLLLILLLVAPIKAAHNTAKSEIPSLTDAWYESLTEIKEDSEDAIITSWWDFGHWFAAISQRKVTFDGADQGNRIHHVGKSLLVNEEESVAILKMFNCGQEKGPFNLEEFLGDAAKSDEIINKIIFETKKEAKITLKNAGLTEEQINNITGLTHCAEDELIPQFYITSEDMIGKSGVWAHFGSWDFNKSKMHNKVRNLDPDEGIAYLEEEFNMSKEDADKTYYDIKSTKADTWISPWPSYMSGLESSTVQDGIVTCSNGIKITLSNYETEIPTQQGMMKPNSIVYATKEGLKEKKFSEDKVGASVALIPNGKGYNCLLMDPALAMSTFTRLYFFEGHGSRYFEKFSDKTTFSGQRIIIWKVNWKPNKPIIMDELEDKTVVKKGDDVSINYIGWTKETGIFDSSILNWESLNITSNSDFDTQYDYKALEFSVGQGQMITGFDNGVIGINLGETKIIEIIPEEAYGTDPTTHPLGNKTLFFKIKVIDIS